MIAFAFIAGCWFGLLVGIGTAALCVSAASRAGEPEFDDTLQDIRGLPEVPA